MVDRVEVTFVPQTTVSLGDSIVYDEDKEKVSFEVPREDAVDENGNLLQGDTHESDELRTHDNAPRKLKDVTHPDYHDGPFRMELKEN